MDVDLNKLDLNLLRILQVLVQTRNAQRTAQELNVSPTTVSRALNNLREQFGESLFIRKPHGLQPSEFAYELALASETMLRPIEQVISKRRNFNHLTYSDNVSIAAHTYLLELFGDQLVDTLDIAFPNAKLKIECWDGTTVAKLISGDLQYGLYILRPSFPVELYTSTINRVENKILFSSNHPLNDRELPIDWHTLTQYPLIQLIISGFNDTSDLTSVEYLKRGFTPRVKLRTDNLKTATHYLEKTNAIMLGSDYIQACYPNLSSITLPNLRDELTFTEIGSVYMRANRDNPLTMRIQHSLARIFK